ncbi:MAG: hypothetical protein IGQ88_12330 [Gloeomargaritaceae cyanobacterium C42_A2020_066]|nr:hypothetical protein [Gloeomargaritaceae cyanobacterium C42_A2020_066]
MNEVDQLKLKIANLLAEQIQAEIATAAAEQAGPCELYTGDDDLVYAV